MYVIGDDEDLGFLDVLFGVLFIIFAALVLLLPHINPVGEKEEQETGRGDGNLLVEITWAGHLDADVDLYVLAPGERVPAYYAHKHSPALDLQRDDLGHTADALPVNYEAIRSRGTRNGEYAIAVNLFSYVDKVAPLETNPVEVFAAVRLRKDLDKSYEVVYEGKVQLRFVKDEAFVIRVTLKDGQLVSTSDIPKVVASPWISDYSL